MTELAVVPSPLSSFDSYRRQLAMSEIAQELQRRAQPPVSRPAVGGDWTDPLDLSVLHRLTGSADPSVTFTELAELLVPSLCEQATAIVHTGRDLIRLRTTAVDVPLTGSSLTGRSYASGLTGIARDFGVAV